MYERSDKMECFRMCKNCDFPGVYAILNINNNNNKTDTEII